MDHFEVLGVNRNCTDDDVRKAYVKLAKVWHPDVNKSSEATEVFQRIASAYDKLNTASSRSRYLGELNQQAMLKNFHLHKSGIRDDAVFNAMKGEKSVYIVEIFGRWFVCVAVSYYDIS